MPFCAFAASTDEAKESLDADRECSLTLSYICEGEAFADVAVKLYKIADVSVNLYYTLTPSFASTNVILNGIKTNGEWNVIRSTLEAHIVADNAEADEIIKTNMLGQACFENLTSGLYLAVVGTVKQGEKTCFFDSALVALPMLNEAGMWQYQVSANSKYETVLPSDEDEEFKIVKLWKGEDISSRRPESIDVEIFKNGVSYEKAVLSQRNNWSYSWTAKKDGSDWTVIERNTPSGYVMTVEKKDNSFVLTNTFIPDNPDDPEIIPPMGNTSNIMLYVLIMFAAGSTLTVFGIIGKRKVYDEA